MSQTEMNDKHPQSPLTFLKNVPEWDEGQTFSMSFNSFEKFPIEMSLCVLNKLLVLGARLFDYVRTK